MSDSPELELSFTQEPPLPIRWRSWPARERLLQTLALVVGLLVAALVIQWLAGQMLLTLLALVALVTALWRFFLPVVFELSEGGVDQWFFGRQRHVPWRAVEGCEVCAAGVLLLPNKDRWPLAPFRGLYVPWTSHRVEVLAHIHHHLDRPGQP